MPSCGEGPEVEWRGGGDGAGIRILPAVPSREPRLSQKLLCSLQSLCSAAIPWCPCPTPAFVQSGRSLKTPRRCQWLSLGCVWS